MTGGYGIAHSEVSTARTTLLHGVQLWVALPDAHRNAARDFQHDVPEPVRVGGAAASDRFGVVEGYPGDRLPAPALPNATILPRRNP